MLVNFIELIINIFYRLYKNWAIISLYLTLNNHKSIVNNHKYIASTQVFLIFYRFNLIRIISNLNKPTILANLKPLSQLLSELDIMLIMKQFTTIDNSSQIR